MNAPLDRRPWVLGGRLPRRPSWQGMLAVAMVLVVVSIPLRGLFIATGSSMEEGFMLVFPERMTKGAVPNVDFLHLYGPLSLQALVGWYWFFGHTLEVQRVFGLLQHLGIIFAVFALARAWGRRAAVVCGVTATIMVITPIGLSALAWEGGVALGVWSAAFGVRALHTEGRARTIALAAAALLAACSLGFRPDLVLALGLLHGWLFWQHRRRGVSVWRPSLIGFSVGLLPIAVHLAMAGIGNSITGMFLDPVKKLRPGRELPRPPSFGQIDGALQAVNEGPLDAPWWRFPALRASDQLFLWFFVVIALAIVLPYVVHRLRRRGATPRLDVLMAGMLFGAGLLPQALQRPDSTHLAFGSCITIALLPCLLLETLPSWRRVWSWKPVTRHPALAAGAIVAVGLMVVCPFYTYRYYLLQSRMSVGNKPGGYMVERDGRRFYFGNEPLQRSSQAVIDQLDASLAPGERLLVGPADLSRTIYSDAVFYYLFPELEPATYYIEMDPGLADAPDSGLADEVASADWLILTNFWTGWYEPNASIEFGSDEPNEVVARDFCLVGNYEDALVLLYQRCEQGDGISPAGIGIGAQRRADFEAELRERSAD